MTEMTADVALRLTGAYALERLAAAKLDFDFLDALILTSIGQANLDPLYRDPMLRIEYATAETCPPDSLRRPISINALSQSMGLPFETVRRRISGLFGEGLVRTTRQGVFVPAAVVSGPRNRTSLLEGYDSLRQLHERLVAVGWHAPAHGDSGKWPGSLPTRLTARISAEFTLRLIRGLTTIVGDPLAVAIWLAILSGDGSGRQTGPTRISALARRLQLPNETTRRRIQVLAARGLCGLTGDGAVVNRVQLERPEFAELAERNLNDLRRMFTQLGDIGVIDAWRATPRTVAPRTIYAKAA